MDKYFKLQRTHSVWPKLQPFLVQRKNLFESVWLYEMGVDWPNNIAYHRSKGSAVLLILDYKQAMKNGYGNSAEFRNLVADSDKTFLVGKKSIAELQRQISSGSLVARWGKVRLNDDVFLLSGDYWLPHCSFSELEQLLKIMASRTNKIFLFHDHAETINEVAQSLRDRLGVDVSGIFEEQKLE